MKKLHYTFTALVAVLCSIQSAGAALVTAGELIVDLQNQDLDASTNVWVNHSTSTNSVGDFQRIDTGNLTVLPALTSSNMSANALHVDQMLANALRSATQTPVLVESNNTRSVEIWVYSIGLDQGTSCTVGWGSSGTDEMSSFNYYNHGGNGMFSAWGNDSGWGSTLLITGEWVYLAYTYDGTTVRGYINGSLEMSYATADANGSGQNLDTTHDYLGIGAARDATADAFVGRIGDVRVHTGVLSDADILNNFGEGMAAPGDLSPFVTGVEDASIFDGQDVTIDAVVSGALPLSYQWESNSVAIAGATNISLTLTNVPVSANGAVYTLVASNAYGTASDSMTLTVNTITVIPPVTINLDVNKQGAGGEYTGLARAPGAGTTWNQFNVNSGVTPIPTTITTVYDSFGNELESCQIIWTSPFNLKSIIKVYKDDSTGNPNPLDLMSDYTYQGDYNVEITSLPAGAYDLYVYAHNNNAGGSTISIAATNGGMLAATTDFGDYRDIWQTNAVGNSYLYMTGVVAEAGGSFSFGISDYLEGFQLQPAQPVIEGLADLTVQTGTNMVLNGGVAGRRPMSFQWSYNGSPLAGETNETLVVGIVAGGDAGEYTLEVSNSIGSDTNSMILTVVSGAAPVINSISVSGGTADIIWISDTGSGYSIESASDIGLSNWVAVVTNLTSVGTNTTPVTVSGNDEEFFRISK